MRWTSRSRVGVNIIPVANARRALIAALRRGESVGLVNDRDISGTGIATPFFGHPAPMSPGPAMLAIEAGVPVYAGSARRTAGGRCSGKLIAVPTPTDGTRRERTVELTNAIAAAFRVPGGEWDGAIYVQGPSFRFPDDGDEQRVVKLVSEAAMQLSDRLVGR